ncbi:ubiquitin domain containing protein, putative [Entamoeba histolytica HM-1:IMSS-B]|uniref:Ubiquitin-like, putative n=8 Tax=Entamoeba TaxID=5758 RepID=C4LVJ5_ENTH1|nr:ubiquitin domain containing protein, putative [Entamoeba nuttalli P19]XP_649463.1 ubiquitin-like, putative [Entamoeba histolytica HM-1:IMSS]EMD48727.1 ubiquitin family protein [Entamoeba histolytica KU27]EMH73319.1 ubiquitin domain containing protein, putative [Entamoeba histolytica HM-1:IMSS-B]EMS13418.1 ubiquitin-like family protein [Entamoeba histolytica HM-3:IMSS]ENY62380.1 ubiquitin-like family protein, putative [Entamoeba histolytica HM-1:IMSS-A]GAT92692.1 ubiquitin domain protein pu|eukprot:XP_008854712.1 ubiquitin domain containing protein, putative [Entamoeba nuttalli P19]
MLINIKLLNGRILSIDLEPTDKISDLKAKLEEIEGITPEQQRLVFGGRQLGDDKTLQELNIQPGTQINLLLALRGGF